jgi:regulation of enolase protein 1 (concanavalin A-like superfamily)
MKTINYHFEDGIPDGFFWFNEPSKFQVGNGLEFWTDPGTDFWQRTHYGFRNDNGHCLLRDVDGDFSLSAQVDFEPQGHYDQCGLILRLDEENWIKASTEHINDEMSKLGSVVTNLGYSDWATQDISSDIRQLWYRASKRGPDVKLEFSLDGDDWQQLRICHLHKPSEKIAVGVYACSPLQSSFWCRFNLLAFGPNEWEKE